MSNKLAELPATSLSLHSDALLSSQIDTHLSTEDGLAETRYTFIEQNHLRQRWQQLNTGPQGSEEQQTRGDSDKHFTIAATEFVSGLSFLCAGKLWLEYAPASARLDFVAIENHPLRKEDLTRVLQQLPELRPLSAELIKQYPALTPGFHRLFFADQRITLTLIFADTSEGLLQLRTSLHPSAKALQSFTVDAWFLSGFPPGEKPAINQDILFEHIAALSGPNTSFAAFTASELVRRTLETQGFAVKKTPAFIPNYLKGEILRGHWQDTHPRDLSTAKAVPSQVKSRRKAKYESPWHIPSIEPTSRLKQRKQAAVIGGGIAGCTTAAALAHKGWQVTLYEQHEHLAAEASGNPQGIIYPKLSPQASALSRINLSALLFASRYYQPYWAASSGKTFSKQSLIGQQCGVLVLPENDKERKAFISIANNFAQQTSFIQLLDQAQIKNICGLALEAELGLYYPALGWINPAKICQQLVQHPNIRVAQARVNYLHHDPDLHHNSGASRWQLADQDQHILGAADTVVLATSTSTGQFSQTKHLPLKSIRGQISISPAKPFNSSTNSTAPANGDRPLKTVICGTGYIAPQDQDHYTFGATYNMDSTTLALRWEDHQRNIDTLNQTAPGLRHTLQIPGPDELDGRAALRCTTLDYLPLIGPAPVFEHFLSDYAALRHDASSDIPCPGRYWPGLYLHCGLGSRGMSYAPLGAELLASQINGDAPALEQDLSIALNPARFIIRDLKRRKL